MNAEYINEQVALHGRKAIAEAMGVLLTEKELVRQLTKMVNDTPETATIAPGALVGHEAPARKRIFKMLKKNNIKVTWEDTYSMRVIKVK